MSIKRTASITVAGLAAAGTIATAAAGTAGAIETVSGDGFAGVVLSHEETVLAAQLHAGDLIDLVYGDDWQVSLPADSIWYTGGWTRVTGHRFIEEAASRRGGNVGLLVQDPAKFGAPFFGGSGWYR
uniref:Secreted protein n=1 Tax=Rhodococcus hoagii TaxID=43767 RepID=A0A1Z1UXB2_RHOHA|nr:hypothetical protein [Prescottella equi]ARX60140.1 hypothetical protein pVAPN1572_1071 [Prescottella equi]